MTRIALFALVLTFAAAPVLADEFGSRFGNTSPYALQNTMDTANEDTQGIGIEDLNDIAPAAGDEMSDTEQAEEPAAQDAETGEEPAIAVDPETKKEEGSEETQPEQGL